MFCPQCRAEYLQGVRECADCGVPLVETLPPEAPPGKPSPSNDDLDLVEVLATFNPGDIAMLESVLDANGVDYLFQGENFVMVQPMVDPARLFVRREQLGLVQELLGELDLTYRAIAMALPRDPAEAEALPGDPAETDDPR